MREIFIVEKKIFSTQDFVLLQPKQRAFVCFGGKAFTTDPKGGGVVLDSLQYCFFFLL